MKQLKIFARSRKLRDRSTAVLASLGVVAMTSGVVLMAATGTAQADDNSEPKDHKVYVCKVVGGPGNYSYQTGQNPIHVSKNAIGDDVRGAGSPFSDAQPSVVLDYDGEGEPDVGDCPSLPPDDDCKDHDKSPQTNGGKHDECDEEEDEDATAVNPAVVLSTTCGVQGSYTIPTTEGVKYYLNDVKIAAGTYSGPASGTITAKAEDDYDLTNSDFSFELNVPAAAVCPTPTTPTTPPATPPVDECPNIEGDQATIPPGMVKDASGDCVRPSAQPAVDVCPNIPGGQAAVPDDLIKNSVGHCVPPEVAGTEEPAPTSEPTVQGTEAVPTVVDAGLPGGPTFTSSSSPTDLLAKSMVGAGLALLMAAGWLQIGRQRRGAHQV